MPLFLAPIVNDQQEDANGAPLVGGSVEVYLAGSSTPVSTYSDQAGLVANTYPIVLNTLGLNSQGAVWLPGGTAYKLVIKDAIGLVQRTIDNVSGINDTTVTVDQWIPYAGPPTYVNATSFTVVGDQTPTFQVGRRLKSANTSGTIYSTITASVYSAPNTTVAVRNDAGALDAGLSSVSYGLLSPLDTSVPYAPSTSWQIGAGGITAASGVITNGDYSLRWKVIGKTVFFSIIVRVLVNGTGAGSIIVSSLPFTFIAEQAFAGRESQTTGFTVGCTGTGSTLTFSKYDGTYPGGSSYRLAVNGVGEIV